MRNNRLSIVALVLAFVALAFSLSQNASALPGMSTVDSGDIVNDTVRGIDVRESSLSAVPVAKSLAPLKSGHSESGVFSGGGGDSTSGYFGDGANFTSPLKAQIPDSHIIDTSSSPNPLRCPGVGEAAKGYLCLYFDTKNSVGEAYGYSSDPDLPTPSVGVTLYFPITADGSFASGSWTVTAK